jgi:hypothetical protein
MWHNYLAITCGARYYLSAAIGIARDVLVTNGAGKLEFAHRVHISSIRIFRAILPKKVPVAGGIAQNSRFPVTFDEI